MSMRSPTQTKPTPKPSFTPVKTGILQRKCACGNSASLTGKCTECENKRLTLQRRANHQAEPDEVPPIVHEVLRSPGTPLDAATRTFMEPRFGHDFSAVRVHTDAKAADSAQAVNALAYTVGRNIVFGNGQYAPQTKAGQRLLAHELTHVVQQGGQSAVRLAQLRVGESEDPWEREADQVADAIAAQGSSSSFQKRIRLPNGLTEEETPFTHSLNPGNRSQTTPLIGQKQPKISWLRSPRLQRAANFVPGTVNATLNLAVQIASGAGFAGFTPPLLNGNQIMSADNAKGAIARPTIGRRFPNISSPRSDPTSIFRPRSRFGIDDPIHAPLIEEFRRQQGLPPGGIGESGERVGPSDAEIKYGLFAVTECWIDSVPTNQGSFRMDTLNNGAWRTVTARANIAARLGLPACLVAGNTTFRANGLPSDADLAASVRTHEDRHAADHERIFNAVLVPWDRALTAAHSPRQVFQGNNPTACETALFAAVGGTPDRIATNLWNGWIGANNAFHASPAGRDVSVSNPNANADCSVSSVDAS